MFELLGNSPEVIIKALIALTIITAVGCIVSKIIVSKLATISKRTTNVFDDLIFVIFSSLNFWFYLLVGIFVSLNILTIPETLSSVVWYLLFFTISFFIIRAFFLLIDFIFEQYKKTLIGDRKKFATILPTLVLIIKIIIFVFAFIFILSNLGVDVTTLIAGLGVGGLVFAFAFQKILSDVFATFVIFFDHPFSVGDSVNFNDVSGSVERVGIKTSIIRSWTGEKIVVPNGLIVNSVVSNLSDRPNRKVTLTIPISYYVEEGNLDKVSGIIEEVIATSNVRFSYARLAEMGEHALLYTAVYYINNATYSEHVSVREKVLIGIFKALNNSKIELGYPIDIDGKN